MRYIEHPGRTFPKLTAVFYVLLLFFTLPILMSVAVEGDSQLFLQVGIYGILLSLTGASLSLLGYTNWSFQRQRELKQNRASTRDEHVVKQIIRILGTGRENQDRLDEYDNRVQKTLMGLVLSLLSGSLPMDILVRGVLLS